MSEVGTITFGVKAPTAKGGIMPKKTGAIIKSLIRENIGTQKEQTVIDERLQKELFAYNYRDEIDRIKEEHKDDKPTLRQKLSDLYTEKKMSCKTVPIFLTDMGGYHHGRMCWPKSNKAKRSFCLNLAKAGKDESATAQRLIDEEGNRQEVPCDPKKCAFAQKETDGNQRCKTYARLAVHLDLPSSLSGLNYYTYRTHSTHTKWAMNEAMKNLMKMTGGFFSQIPMEMVLTDKTVMGIDQSGREVARKIPVIRIRPRVSVKEVIELAFDHADKFEKIKSNASFLERAQMTFSFTEEDQEAFKESNDFEESDSMEDVVVIESSEPTIEEDKEIIEDSIDIPEDSLDNMDELNDLPF